MDKEACLEPSLYGRLGDLIGAPRHTGRKCSNARQRRMCLDPSYGCVQQVVRRFVLGQMFSSSSLLALLFLP